MEIKINITQSDIDNGEPNNAENCALALACKRKFNQKVIISYSSKIFIHALSWKTPMVIHNKTLLKFLKSFDNHDLVKPMSVDIDI